MTTTTTPKLTLADVNRKHIARETGMNLAQVSRLFNPNLPNELCGWDYARKVAAVLGLAGIDELADFLERECGKNLSSRGHQ